MTPNGVDPYDKFQCQVCGRLWPVPSLALFCAAKDQPPHEVAHG